MTKNKTSDQQEEIDIFDYLIKYLSLQDKFLKTLLHYLLRFSQNGKFYL